MYIRKQFNKYFIQQVIKNDTLFHSRCYRNRRQHLESNIVMFLIIFSKNLVIMLILKNFEMIFSQFFISIGTSRLPRSTWNNLWS